MRIVQPSVVLESITSNAVELIERAGRTCYKSEEKIGPGTVGPFIKTLRARGHLSVLEHASATFRVICDRGVSHEAVRHRLCSYSMESTRFCCYSKDRFGGEIAVIMPPGLDENQRGVWQEACKFAEAKYFELLSSGQSPQIARSVLPTCLRTELVWTANFREWLHIIELRTSPAAHPQMREIARAIRDQLRAACPEVFVVG